MRAGTYEVSGLTVDQLDGPLNPANRLRASGRRYSRRSQRQAATGQCTTRDTPAAYENRRKATDCSPFTLV